MAEMRPWLADVADASGGLEEGGLVGGGIQASLIGFTGKNKMALWSRGGHLLVNAESK